MSSLTKISLLIAIACLAVLEVASAETHLKTRVETYLNGSDLADDVITEDIIEPLETLTCSCDKSAKPQSKKSLESNQRSTNYLVTDQTKPDDEMFVERSKPMKTTSSSAEDLEHLSTAEPLTDVKPCAKTDQEKDSPPASGSEKDTKVEVKTPEKPKNYKNNSENDKKSSKKRSKREAKDKSSKSKTRKGGKDGKKKSKAGKNRK